MSDKREQQIEHIEKACDKAGLKLNNKGECDAKGDEGNADKFQAELDKEELTQAEEPNIEDWSNTVTPDTNNDNEITPEETESYVASTSDEEQDEEEVADNNEEDDNQVNTDTDDSSDNTDSSDSQDSSDSEDNSSDDGGDSSDSGDDSSSSDDGGDSGDSSESEE